MSKIPTSLVVGAQGLMGTRTVEVMQQKGWNVFRGGRRKEDAADFRYIDLEDEQTFSAALEGVDIVFNVVQDATYVRGAGGGR